jgi:acetyltransferase-like isoleucine patch superfamily enzyme
MPNTKISGEVKIGNRNFFGVGSTVLQQITIGNDTVVGANSLIFRNTKDGMTYIGSPAKIMKY